MPAGMDPDEKPSLKGYWHNLKASFRPMMQRDLREGDWGSAFISVLAPHFQLYHSIKATNQKMKFLQPNKSNFPFQTSGSL